MNHYFPLLQGCITVNWCLLSLGTVAKMQSLVIVGLQWGDEGKGKLVDFLSEHFDIVARFQGGSNAGHTVKVGEDVFKFRLIPTGAVRGKKVVIGNGVVVDPVILVGEIDQLRTAGISVDLLLSERAHVIMPHEIMIDELQESGKGDKKVGTTKRGIGPTYAEKVSRTGLRVCDAFSDTTSLQWNQFLSSVRRQIEGSYGSRIDDSVKSSSEASLEALHQLRSYIGDSGVFLQSSMDQGAKVLFEGAQGTLLDIDHGTYPYVTSSNCTAACASTGTGVPLSSLEDVLGIVKAYQTRVGAGPFPTELHDKTGELIRDRGGEYGTVTGRPRRCGWLDLVALRYAVRINGSKHLAVTKIDILTGIDPLKVCIGYEIDGFETTQVPAEVSVYEKVKPVYEEIDGWSSIAAGAKNFSALPEELLAYLKRIESFTGSDVIGLSIGPERTETIIAADWLSELN